MKKLLVYVTLLTLTVLIGACTSIKSKPIFADDDGALRGFDPVAYFQVEAAVKGDTAFSYDYGGATFYFSSETNRQSFIAEPQRYLPQYGGYCAYGMSRNFVVSTDPYAFTLVDGKLYLNYSLKVRKTWLKDVPGNIVKADENWADKLASGQRIEE